MPSTVQIVPQALKIAQAREYLGGVSDATIRRLVERRILKRVPDIRHIVITKSSLDQFLARAEAPR